MGEIKNFSKELNNNFKHGLSTSKEYNSWRGMKARCYNINHPKYKNYGGRDIIVSNEWKDSFETFLKDINNAPSKEYSIERIDVNGNYCKENCIWATNEEQKRNKTNSLKVTYKGETKLLIDFCKELGLKYTLINARLKANWNVEKAFETEIGIGNTNGYIMKSKIINKINL